jgi:hypothetical protein
MIPIFLGLCLAALGASAAAIVAGLHIANAPADLRAAAVQNHQLLGLAAAVLLLVSQCAVFVYFLGTGKAIKTAVETRGLNPEFALRTRRLKGKTFPFATFSSLAVVAGTVLSGATAPSTHAAWTLTGIGLTLLAIPFEIRSIRENTKLMDSTEVELVQAEARIVEAGGSLEDPDAAPPAFLLGRWLVVVGLSTWLVFAYQKVVMRGDHRPWPWYVLVCAVSLAIGIPLLLLNRRERQSAESSL